MPCWVVFALCLLSSYNLPRAALPPSKNPFLLITVNIFVLIFLQISISSWRNWPKSFLFLFWLLSCQIFHFFLFLFISKFFQHSKPVQPPTHIYLSIEFVLLVIVSFAYRKLWKLGTRRCNNKINKFDKELWLVCVVYETIKINGGRTLS